MPESIDVHRPDTAPAPGPETRRLGALVGRWRSEGYIVGDARVPITGTDVYEWLPGGFFLVHHVDVVIGDQKVQAIELIGEYDSATDSFTARAYDNLGNVTIMHARVDDRGVWTFTGGGEVAPVAQLPRRRRWGRALDADGERRPEQHDGKMGAQRRRRRLAAVDEHAVHPDAVAGGRSPWKSGGSTNPTSAARSRRARSSW
jgi:hypothetical protein